MIDDDANEDLNPPLPRRPGLIGTVKNDSARHTGKNRNTMASTTHDPIYNQLTYYSTAQAPYCDWRKQSPSTDRTISVPETTAATSLQSQVSNGYHISSLDYGAISQKRKRTRAVALDEVKQTMRELNHDDNPLSLYQPPPNTVIKAKNVHVQVVLDVRPSELLCATRH